MAKKIVSADDAVIRKILNDPRHEIAGKVAYQTAEGINEYTPTVNVPKTDTGIQKILNNPANEIAGSVAYDKGNTRYKYTPDNVPATPSYAKSGGAKPDYAANMDALAKMGDWDAVYKQGNERIAKIAQSGGYDNGVNTYDYINQLIERYPEQYQKYRKNKERQKLVDLVSRDVGTQYDDLYQSLLKKYGGYDYDKFLKSNQYKSMQNLYELAGQKAMKDTLGEISARTGGYSSSYAEAAAQEQYQQYMAQLAKLANDMYEGERQGMRQDLNLLGDRMDTERSWKRQLGLDEYNALMQFANEDRSDTQRAEDLAREDQYNREAREREDAKTTRQEARESIWNALVNSGMGHSELPPELIAASGYSDAEMVAMEKIYSDNKTKEDWEKQLQEKELEMKEYQVYNGGSSGGGGGRRRGSGGKTPKGNDETKDENGDEREKYTYNDLMVLFDRYEGANFDSVAEWLQQLFKNKQIDEETRDAAMIEAQKRYA